MPNTATSPKRARIITRLALIAASLPAIVGSVLLMGSINVGNAWFMQILVAEFCIVLVFILSSQKLDSPALFTWLFGVAALATLATLIFATGGAPHRWLSLGPVRLYVASAVLPVALLCLPQFLNQRNTVAALWVPAIALLLAAQPDAAQVTAFSIAALYAFFCGTHFVRAKLIVTLILALCVLAAWWQPDPLEPVAHVEGVLYLALGAGRWALVIALLSLAIPVAVLIWLSQRVAHRGPIVVALYYAVIYAMTYAQLTPVPLLGFGAGPLIGYFAMAIMAERLNGATLTTTST